ncbi:MAG TPA: lipocalin family protein [Flavipsychrobacter sp.]|nr:lipocalin family protein [Flavipsychrobacter sp.]
MKKIANLLILSLVLFATACTKKDEGTKFSYVVSNVQDISVNAGASNVMTLLIEYKEGSQEPVDLKIAGLPTGVTGTFTPGSGTPSYSSILELKASPGTVAGKYPVKMVATSKSGITREYNFNLTIATGNQTTLMGTWTIKSSGTDINGDGKYQSEEANVTIESDIKLTFSEDHKGVIVINIPGLDTSTESFIWQLTNERELTLTFQDGTTTNATIASLNTSELIIGYMDGGVLNWERYSR